MRLFSRNYWHIFLCRRHHQTLHHQNLFFLFQNLIIITAHSTKIASNLQPTYPKNHNTSDCLEFLEIQKSFNDQDSISQWSFSRSFCNTVDISFNAKHWSSIDSLYQSTVTFSFSIFYSARVSFQLHLALAPLEVVIINLH